MAKILVSLLSDQPIPNVQLIKEFDFVDEHIFISTEKMEGKQVSTWIKKANNIQKPVQVIEINEFDFDDISSKMEKFEKFDDAEFYVNITGGTKVMSISALEYFKNKSSKVFYITGKQGEYLQIFPKIKDKTKKMQTEITLLEYLQAYGIELKNPKNDTTTKNLEQTSAFFDFFINLDDKKNISVLRDFYKDKNNKKNHIKSGFLNIKEQMPDLYAELQQIPFDFEQDGFLSVAEINYIIGGWLEEYVFLKLKTDLNIQADFIGLNLNLFKSGIEKSDNEFDVILFHKNRLFIFECKTSHYVPERITDGVDGENNPKFKVKNTSKLGDYIYKLDALCKEFGLFASAYIFTLSNLPINENERQTVNDRLKFHKITLINDKANFNEIISKIQSL